MVLCYQATKSFEPAHEIMVLVTWATSEGSGDPAHPRNHQNLRCSHT